MPADHALLVRPSGLRPNDETAGSNAFQRPTADPAEVIRARALDEHAGLARALGAHGVPVVVLDDPEDLPDAVFPNNWVSFHEDGTAVLYPMLAPSRRRERSRARVEAAAARAAFPLRRVDDRSGSESEGRFLEGTGSLVLDRAARVAYACRSPRTDRALAEAWARDYGYELVFFEAFDPAGRPVYHTNVLLTVGASFALVASDAIAPGDRGRVLAALAARGEVVEISTAAMAAFAGNALELRSATHGRVLALSTGAWAALPSESRTRVAARVDRVVAVPFDTIERVGGGGVRCAIAVIPGT